MFIIFPEIFKNKICISYYLNFVLKHRVVCTGPARLGGKRGTASGHPPKIGGPHENRGPSEILSLVLNFQFDY